MKKKTVKVKKVSKKLALKDAVVSLQNHMIEAFNRFGQSPETTAIIESLKAEQEKLK